MQGIEMWFSGETGIADKRIPCTLSITIVAVGLLSIHSNLEECNLPPLASCVLRKAVIWKRADSYPIFEQLILKRLLVIRPVRLNTWLKAEHSCYCVRTYICMLPCSRRTSLRSAKSSKYDRVAKRIYGGNAMLPFSA